MTFPSSNDATQGAGAGVPQGAGAGVPQGAGAGVPQQPQPQALSHQQAQPQTGGTAAQQPGGFAGQYQQQYQGMPQQGPIIGGTRQFAPVPNRRSNPLAGVPVPVLLSLGALVLALVSYFVGYSDAGGAVTFELSVLLAGGLLCGLRAVPRAAPAFLPVGAVLSVVGALSVLAGVVRASGIPTSIVLILIFAVLQLIAAVGAYLLDAGIVRPATPAPSSYPQQSYPQQPGGWPQPVQYSQQAPQAQGPQPQGPQAQGPQAQAPQPQGPQPQGPQPR